MSICPLDMNVYARFDEIPSMALQDIEETKRYGHTRTDGRENSIPTHKHSLWGGGIIIMGWSPWCYIPSFFKIVPLVA